ncbi:arginine repressor [Woeseia oceani]|uniref:Arginine repressor n=1 Tax=Woeseia oceani TaxID=1548547 RepID=A0A193LCM0_9GAMM|nr:hypothetical protein [Woeseia oceani]ANO50181.1 hypothetical protein BA177_02160 [Woeseia oceani]
MPDNSHTPNDRRNAIKALLAAGPAATQQSLVEALTAQGFVATQSSVSRDLRELTAIKTPAGYVLPQPDTSGDDEVTAVASLLRNVRPAGPNLLVIHTAIGGAQRVALALDRCGWPEIIGNVGGDDTVFTATASASDQRAVITRIEHCANRS